MFRTLLDLIDGIPGHGANPAILAMRRKTVETWSYADLADRVDTLAGSLVKAGIGKDDPVALLSDNRPEWIAAALAVMRAGAVTVPIDVQVADDTLAHILRDSGARLLFTTTAYADRLQRIEATGVRPVLLDVDDDPWSRLPTGGDRPMPSVEPEDRATLFYTSGTTGPPKGVPLSHGNIASQINAIVAGRIAFKGDRVLLPLPLHHVYPFVFGMLAPLSLGLPTILPRALTGPQVAAALREGAATLIMGVPRLYSAFDAGIRGRFESGGRVPAGLYRAGVAATTWSRKRFGLRAGKVLRPLHRRIAPDLRLLVSGGAALDPELAFRLEGFGWRVASGYGLTETSPMLTWNLPGRAKLDSAGEPVPGVELRIGKAPAQDAGEASQEANASRRSAGQRFGEIMAKGPGVFSGYHHLPDKTAEAFTEDGWFRTGDLGYLDADGYLHIVGRVSTMIVTEGGENVDPETVEEAYAESPAIREIGVLERNRRLVALVVPQEGGEGEPEQAAEEALSERSRALPSYQRISDYAVTREPLSRTRLGKLRRHLLEERFDRAKQGRERPQALRPVTPDEMSPEDRALLEDDAARQVWGWLAERHSDRRLTPGTNMQVDLGIDSMDWLNLTLEIGQRTGVDLDEEVVAEVETVRDLLREVGEAAEAGERFEASVLDDPEAALSDEEKRWLEPLAPSQARLARELLAANRILMRSLFRLRAEGLDRLPSRQVVLTPTHGSFLDPFVVAAALDRERLARTFWAGAADMAFGNPLTRRVSRLAQAMPIDTQHRFVSGLALAAAVLKRGNDLIWFPEGARSRSNELQEFKPGIGMLLERYPVPVVPVAIYGAHDAYPPGRMVPRPYPIRIVFGEALDPKRLEREGDGKEAMHRITSALRRHTEELYRGVRTAARGRD